MTAVHVPVMLKEVLGFLRVLKGDNPYRHIIDATLGLGGYSEALLREFPELTLFGIDQDRFAIDRALDRLKVFGDRFEALEGNFSHMGALLESTSVKFVNAVIFDLGVSNMQISVADRGFSFRHNGPLDMRMDSGSSGGKNAYDIVNFMEPDELSHIFKTYGEEKFSWKIAKAIEKYRDSVGMIEDTDTLVAIIRDVIPVSVMRKTKGHPARKVFQAIRIYVNDEMGVLDRGLDQALKVLAPGGTIIVVDYHSLEDRIVKWRFRNWQEEELGKIVTRKALTPGNEEIEINPKSRSAKLRVFMKKPDIEDEDNFFNLPYRVQRDLIKNITSRV